MLTMLSLFKETRKRPDWKRADYGAKELAKLVYTPLWKEATSWLDPATPTFTVGTWSNLESEKRYLIPLVPRDIAEIFNQAKVV